eukprot:gene28877-37889_t
MIEDKVFPTLAGLAPAFSYAIVLSILRYVFHYILFKPLALRSMKIKEVHFHNIKDIDKSLPVQKLGHSRESVLSYCNASGRMEDDVNSYLWSRKRHLLIRKKIVKYVEAFWRAIFYVSFSVVGYYALFTPELLWTEVSRSDALEMIVHHLITICLLARRYCSSTIWLTSSSRQRRCSTTPPKLQVHSLQRHCGGSRMVFRLVKGDMTKDERSDDEEELEEKPSSLGTDKVDSNKKKKK